MEAYSRMEQAHASIGEFTQAIDGMKHSRDVKMMDIEKLQMEQEVS